MIHTARQSPKFLRLVRKLRPLIGQSIVDADAIATAILERLWHATIVGAVRGDIGRFDNDCIAEMCGWLGDADYLISILVECGWLDLDDTHRLLVHDWEQHAPRHVKQNIHHKGGFITPEVRGKPQATSESFAVSGDLPRETPQFGSTPNLTQPNLTKQNQTERSFVAEGPTTAEVVESVFLDWNEHAAAKCMTAVRSFSDDRKAKIRTRIRRKHWLEDFRLACAKLPIPGDGWQPDLDWLIANDTNVSKVLEGKYDWRNGKQKALDDFDGL